MYLLKLFSETEFLFSISSNDYIFDYDRAVHSYSQGAFSFSFADCNVPLDRSVIPILLDFPEFSGGDIIETPFCSMSPQLDDFWK